MSREALAFGLCVMLYGWRAIVLGTCTYLVFWRDASGWWFLLAMLLCGSAVSIGDSD